MAYAANDVSEENHFFELFIDVLNELTAVENMQGNNIQDENISEAIGTIIQSFRYDLGRNFTDIDYQDPVNRLAYLFRYSTHGACLARNRVLHAVNHCPALQDCFGNAELNVISLGGGPGNDIVGLCSALQDIECPSSLKLTVVDHIRQWNRCLDLVTHFLRTSDYGNASSIFQRPDVNLSFIQVDLPGNIDQDEAYFASLREADVILIQKLLSILTFRKKEAVIQSLRNHVKPGALVLYIDSPFSPLSWSLFDILYISDLPIYMRRYPANLFGSNDAVSSKAQIAVLRKK